MSEPTYDLATDPITLWATDGASGVVLHNRGADGWLLEAEARADAPVIVRIPTPVMMAFARAVVEQCGDEHDTKGMEMASRLR